MYTVNGKTAATSGTIDHAIAQLWNPSSTRHLHIYEIYLFKQAAGGADEPVLRRSTARGTPGSTITPTIVNDHERDLAPVTGALLDLSAFTVQPTLEAVALHGALIPATAGSAMIWVLSKPLKVPPGNGLVITQGIGTAFPVCRTAFSWEDL